MSYFTSQCFRLKCGYLLCTTCGTKHNVVELHINILLIYLFFFTNMPRQNIVHFIRKGNIVLGQRFKSAGQPMLQCGLVEVGQRNPQIHMLDQFLSFGKTLLI